jgi:16S rRNA (cytidine1402-2'-O)-methyltransferase
MTGTLYLVATPIGNLEDITLRALRVLREADLIACEDTRHTQGLLNHFNIKKRTVSYHEHNEGERAVELLAQMTEGANVALVSDAGTPAISDPGFRLVRACLDGGVRVVPVPGPTALISALIASGLPTDEFFFGGFLPARSLARRQRWLDVRELKCTLIFYETPHRLAQSLTDAREILGDRPIVIARELTKLHEEIQRGRLSELVERRGADEQKTRGEIVLVIERAPEAGDEMHQADEANGIASRVAALEAEGVDHKTALKRVARELGLPRDEAYRRLIAERSLKE